MSTIREVTEKELSRANRELVRAMAARKKALERLRAAELRLGGARRQVRLLLQSVMVELTPHEQRGDSDLERVYAELATPVTSDDGA